MHQGPRAVGLGQARSLVIAASRKIRFWTSAGPQRFVESRVPHVEGTRVRVKGTDSMDDNDRLDGSSQDDVFASWYRDHFERLRRLCVRMLDDPAGAEDIAQETLLRAWLGRDRMRAEDLGAWLTVVARNLCVSHMRKRWRAVPHDVLPDVVDHRHDPAAAAERSETRRTLQRALQEVGDRHRRLLMLREIGDIEYSELGEELGLSEGGTRSLLFRARRRLRERLAAAGEGFGVWVAGIKIRTGTVTRRIHNTFGSLDASTGAAILGMHVAFAAGLAFMGTNAVAAVPAHTGHTSANTRTEAIAVEGAASSPQPGPAKTQIVRVAVDSSRTHYGWEPGPKLGEGKASGGLPGPLGATRDVELFIRWSDDPAHDSRTFALRDAVSEVVCPAPGLCTGD